MLNWYYFKDLVVESVDKGFVSMEEVHSTIANLPFEMLEKVEPLAEATNNIQEIQEKTTHKVYDMIRSVNQQIGEIPETLWPKKREKGEIKNAIKSIKGLVVETIDKGATSTEEIHKSILNLPFKMLTKIAPFSDTIHNMKEIQTSSIGKVYDMIRTVNENVGEFANHLLKSNGGQDKESEKPKLKVAK